MQKVSTALLILRMTVSATNKLMLAMPQTEKQSNYCTCKRDDVSEDAFRVQDRVQELLNKATKFLLEMGPSKYSLVRILACFDPREIVRDPEDSK